MYGCEVFEFKSAVDGHNICVSGWHKWENSLFVIVIEISWLN
jgi:hypothetical protein